jgi:hypothetical protein
MTAPLLSVFTNNQNRPLTKVYQRVNGVLQQRQSPLIKGRVKTLAAPTAADIAMLCSACRSHQALGLGVTGGTNLPIVAEALLTPDMSAITRSLRYFYFLHQPTWLLIDSDFKGISAEALARLKAAGSVWPVLVEVEPALRHVAHMERASASASLVDLSGKRMLGGGRHIYLLIDDGLRARDVLLHLHKKCWAAGLGWVRISDSGQMLERSLIDVSVASPERIVNEGPPIVLG